MFFSMTIAASLLINEALINKIEKQYGEAAVARVMQWLDLIDQSKDLPEQEKLTLVNTFFNTHIRFMDDIDLWFTRDYWATPIEFMAIGAGDCEDFSIAKYFTLKELGIDEDKLRLTYVKAIQLNQAHMVLTYKKDPDSVPVVLDNLIAEIKPAPLRDDLVPIYSFNGIGLWLAKKRGMDKYLGHSNNLDLWAELRLRMMEITR